MSYHIPINAWREGKQAVSDGKVRKISRTFREDRRTMLTGHVDSSFGFVHHPVVEVDESLEVITRFTCDCWMATGGGKPCCHCVAILAAVYDIAPMVTATPEDNQTLAYSEEPNSMDSGQTPSVDSVTILEVRSEGEAAQLKGKVRCDFGFVHYPSIALRDGTIAEYSCDCYYTADSAAPCPHCKLLQQKYIMTQIRPEDSLPQIDFRETIPEFHEISDPDILEASVRQPPALFGKSEIVSVPPVQTQSASVPTSMKILMGRDDFSGEKVFWCPNDTERLVNMNTGIIGTMGTGKTQLTKSMLVQLLRQQPNNFDGHDLGILIFDYKGDYNATKEDFLRATGARVLVPQKLPFNPLSLRGIKAKPQLPYHVASAFANILTGIYHLGPVQYNSLLTCLISAYERCGITSDPATWGKDAPTFEQVYEIYNQDGVKQDALYSAMYSLHQFQVFEPRPYKTTSLYNMLTGAVVMDLSGYDTRIQNLVVAITLENFCSQMLNSDSSRRDDRYRQLTKIILVDEADNIMSAGFPALKTILKEGREFGVGTILSTQSLRHFCIGTENYASYILTWIVHAVPDMKRSDVESIFKVSGAQAENIALELSARKKHESLARIGNAAPVFLRDLPFWEIAEDTAESYLSDGV